MRLMFGLAVLLAATFSCVSADTLTPSDRVQTRLRIKEEPHRDSDVAMYLHPGEVLPLISSDNRYYHEVRLPNNASGWASKSWSRIIPDIPSPAELVVNFFDVGQGDSTLIECPNGQNILIDAGSTSGVEADLIQDQLFETLEGRERRIHTLIVSHPDADHYNRLHLVLQGINVDQVFMIGIEDDYYMYFWDWLEGLNTNRTVLDNTDFDQADTPNTQIDCGSAEVYILAANEQSNFSSKNTASIVVMVRFGSFEAILPGDATRVTEGVILDRYQNSWLDVDLLKIGHHGSLATSTTVNWANTLSPEIAVVSAGVNRYGHPRTEVIQRLEGHTVSSAPHSMRSATRPDDTYVYTNSSNYQESIYSTQVLGRITVTSDGTSWNVTSASANH